jgi:hypothetical protein
VRLPGRANCAGRRPTRPRRVPVQEAASEKLKVLLLATDSVPGQLANANDVAVDAAPLSGVRRQRHFIIQTGLEPGRRTP